MAVSLEETLHKYVSPAIAHVFKPLHVSILKKVIYRMFAKLNMRWRSPVFNIFLAHPINKILWRATVKNILSSANLDNIISQITLFVNQNL
jgi:hypothetical protein